MKFIKSLKVYTLITVINILLFNIVPAYVQTVPEITPKDFVKMVRGMSEESGYFRGESWVTNELTYLDVIEDLKKNQVRGGVYIGVAPEQNFTYIAVIRPELVFLVDIRAQNKIQHLIFKAFFELSETRAEFLSNLFSIPLKGNDIPGKGSDINQIVEYLERSSTDHVMFESNLLKIMNLYLNKYGFNFTAWEKDNIEYVLRYFYRNNLNITNGPWRSNYPTLAEILTDTDHKGRQLNAFNNRDDYLFLKKMHMENKIIPLTGDYGKNFALSKVSEYLKEHKLTVSAQYVSNVEQYLIRSNRNWNGWIKNISNLPLSDKSVFIRWLNWNYYNQETRLQYMRTFIRNSKSGRYNSYRDLLNIDYIK